MARQITLELVGDADRLSKTMSQVTADSKKMADKVEDQAGKVRKSFDKMGEGADQSEGKFMGMADVLDGLGGAFGLPTEKATGMMRAFGDLSGGFATLQPAVGGIATFMKTNLTSAMTMVSSHPLLLVVGLLTVAFIALYAKSEAFRDIINSVAGVLTDVVVGAFNWVKTAAVGVFNWVKDNWPLLFGILTGPIGLAVVAVVKNWDTIKNAFTAVKDWIGDRIGDIVGFITGIPGRIASVAATMWDGIKNAFTGVKNWLSDRLGDIIGFYADMPARITRAAAGMFDGIKDAFRGAINTVIDWWNGLDFALPKIHVPGTPFDVGGFTLGTPDLPHLAGGGTFSGAALVGERGPELLVGAGRVIPNDQLGGVTLNAYFYGPQDPVGVTKQIEAMLTDYKRQGGNLRFLT